jgi:hypothetical protein
MSNPETTEPTEREIELLLWKSLVDEGGSMTVPYVSDLPERRVRFIRHKHYWEAVADGR